MNKGRTQIKGVLMLLLTAIIWGASFVSQSVGMESVGAFTFNGIRTLMGAAVLLPIIVVRALAVRRLSTPAILAEKRRRDIKTCISGALLGVVFCAAGNFQQFAFNYSTPGKIAFITALYMFFVPLLGLFLKKRVLPLTWGCVSLGFVGLYFLCINPADFTAINKGDILSFICALMFAVHILMVDRFAAQGDGILLSFVQFTVSGTISCILMFIFEEPELAAINSAMLPLLYSGVMSCGVAYTFQIIGQKYTSPTAASLLMCMESVFAVLAAALILKQILSPREVLGCCIMFAAIIVSQLAENITERLRAKSS